MLNCEYCDYLKMTNEKETEKGHYCTFCGHIISAKAMIMDEEYPCKDISYAEYVSRNNTSKEETKDDNWKIIYKTKRPAPEKKNYPLAV
ncbi:MAG TPA: hypothetical protein VN131_02655 [Mobilitalea sp.]|nr:hypothetical protein [Mobilitalea sp.]